MESADPFWEFSLQLYQQPGVAEHCLALQDEYGADVNILLFCCWLGSIGAGPLSMEQLQLLLEQVKPWQKQAIVPLRMLRRQLKKGVSAVAKDRSEAIRQAIQRVEIDAERVEQSILSESCHWQANAERSLSDRTTISRRNLQNYFRVLQIPDDAQIQERLQALISAASAL